MNTRLQKYALLFAIHGREIRESKQGELRFSIFKRCLVKHDNINSIFTYMRLCVATHKRM
jgi:hypothetical protein